MVDKKIIIVGFLTIVILASGIVYINLEDLKIRVDNDKTTFYVLEDSRWRVSGREINSIFDGTSKMNRDRSGITVNTTIEGNFTKIVRVTPYLRGAIIKDTYTFRGDIKDKELFPISHKIEIINGNICGERECIYDYQIKDLVYTGETKKLNVNEMSFGRNMKVEWDSNFYYAKVYKYSGQDKGKLTVRYRITSDYEVFYNRLFDPEEDYADFETSFDNWTQGAGGSGCDWYRGTSTPSVSTGPQGGGVGGAGTYFVFVEASSGSCYSNGDKANLTSNEFTWTGKVDDQISFYYNMYGSNIGQLFLEENSTGSWVELWNRSGDDGGSGTVWTQINISLSSLSGSGNLRFRNIAVGGYIGDTAIDRINVTYDSMGENETSTTLYLDDLSADRYYEHGTICELKANVTNSTGSLVYNASGNNICLNIDQVDYGDDFICGNGSISYNLTTNSVKSVFNDSSSSKNLTYTNATENKTFYINFNKYDEIQSAYLNLTGFENTSWPLNTKIYVNDTLVDSISGYLGAGNQTLDEFNNSNTIENLTFSGSGTKERYLKIPKTANVTSAYLDLKGYINYVNTIDAEYSGSCSGIAGDFGDCENAFDESWLTGAWLYADDFSQPVYIEHYVYNYSSASWSLFNSDEQTTGTERLNVINYTNVSGGDVCSVGNYIRTKHILNTTDIGGYETAYIYQNYTYQDCSILEFKVRYDLIYYNEYTYSHLRDEEELYKCYKYIDTPYIDTADSSGGSEWNWTGEFTPSNGTQTANLNVTLINTYLSTCSEDSEGYCDVPILFSSESAGILEVSNIIINYTYTIDKTRDISASTIQTYLDAQSSGFHNVPIRISSETNTIIQVDNINITYYGSDNISVMAHFDGDGTYSVSNDTQIVKVVYSRINHSVEPNYGYLEFIPANPTSQNVLCYGGLSAKPCVNFTFLNYDQNSNLSIRINESMNCSTLTANTEYNVSGAYEINTSWYEIDTNKQLLNTTNLWLWMNYNCSNVSQWYLEYPYLEMKSYALEAVKSE